MRQLSEGWKRSQVHTKRTWSIAIGRGGAILWVALCLLPTLAQAAHEQIRIPYPTDSERKTLADFPDLELMGDDDGALILLSRPEITAELQARGIQVEIQIPDLEDFYRKRIEAEGGPRGDFGVWHTYAETVAEMNLLHSEYPNLTTAPASIGLSIELRQLWSMKVSDNPGVDEAEPEVLFDGVHHAREIMTVEMNLSFMRYLCENYGSDQVITDLVNSREIWFVPIVNPDGFVFNEQTDPNGGGLWRKNRRPPPVGSNCWGVDPNRNYSYQWGGSGSSPEPCDETYRGVMPESEPEIQHHTNFIDAHEFVTWNSYHSVAGMVLFPWGYTLSHTPDDATFRTIAAEMASVNNYQIGQPPEILYQVNGGSFDWGYGDTTQHPKIFCFTTEIGGSGFWPNPSERDGLIAQNLYSNIYLCQIAGAYLQLVSLTVTGGNGNGILDPGETASLVVTARNIGVIAGANNVQARLLCDDPYVTLSDAVTTLGNLAPGASGSSNADPFDLQVDASCPQGRSIGFTVELTADGGVESEGSIALTVGALAQLYANDFEQAGEAWLSDPSHTATSGSFVRIDPNPTAWQPGDDTTPAPGVFAWVTGQNSSEGVDDVDGGISATRSSTINLAAYSHVELDLNYFFGQRDPGDDPVGDFLRIDLSNNNGASFPVNLVSVGDVTYEATWRNLRVDLEDFLPLTSQMVVRVQAADGSATGDVVEAGLDDIYLFDRGNGNEPPSTPGLVSPPNGSPNETSTPTLVVSNATDPEGDPLTYGFRVYSDSDLTQLVASVDGVAQGIGSTSWTVTPSLPLGLYYWRAYAADPTSRGLYMAAATFTVTIATDVAENAGAAPLLSVGPNPSQGETRIRYFVPSAAFARIEIHDSNGRRVRSLEGARWSHGWKEVVWDGRDQAGLRVAAGIYWVRLVLPNETRAVRVVQVH